MNLQTLAKDSLHYLWRFLPNDDLRNVRLAYCNPREDSYTKIRDTALVALAWRKESYLPGDIRVSLIQFCKKKGIARDEDWVLKVYTYLKSGHNAKTRFAAVENKKEFKNWAPLKVLKNFSTREQKSYHLFSLVIGEDTEKLKKELQKDETWVNAASKKDGSPLIHLAVTCEQPEVVQILLDNGADVNAVTSDGDTPLHSIAHHVDLLWLDENLLIATNLIKHHANVNAVNRRNQTPLHKACFFSASIAKLLLVQGAYPNVVNKSGQTPLHNVLNSDRGSAGVRFDLVMLLLEKGALPNIKDNKGKTPLDYAVHHRGNATAIGYLLDNGAQHKDLGGLLRIAALLHHADIVKALIRRGADVNASDKVGRTALHDAASSFMNRGKADSNGVMTVNTLLNAGADVNAINDHGYTPLSSARTSSNRDKAVEALLAKSGGVDPIRRKRIQTAIILAALLLVGTHQLWTHRAKIQALFRTS